jgi:hypothetical protein
MKSAQIIRVILASLMLAIMAIARTAQAGPTPTPSPAPQPAGPLEATPTPFPSPPTSPSPVPMLYLKGQEHYTANGHNFVRYTYDVLNRTDYPAALFAPAPNLPPCGANTIPLALGWTSSINLESVSTDFALLASRRTSMEFGLRSRKA